MEKVKRIQELRRSNAATAIKNKKKYTRKQKYKNIFEQRCGADPHSGVSPYVMILITLRHAEISLRMSV